MAMHGTLVSLNVCAPVVAGLTLPPFLRQRTRGARLRLRTRAMLCVCEMVFGCDRESVACRIVSY